MEPKNNVTYFVLLGLTQNPKEQKVLSVMFLLFYILTMLGNMLIVVTVTFSRTLGSPMYFFLASLSFMDAIYSSVVSPKLISDLFFGENTLSFRFCMAQLFTEHFFGGSEVFLLLVMAYDHYVAICKPLHYLVIMRKWVCVVSLVVSWVGGFLHSVIQLSTIYGLPFCGPNVIDHFICDMYPLLKLVCTDTHTFGLFIAAQRGFICSLNFLLLLVSNMVIIYPLNCHSLDAIHLIVNYLKRLFPSTTHLSCCKLLITSGSQFEYGIVSGHPQTSLRSSKTAKLLDLGQEITGIPVSAFTPLLNLNPFSSETHKDLLLE
nr:putative olfactory receptor 4A4 [Equus caballus]